MVEALRWYRLLPCLVSVVVCTACSSDSTGPATDSRFAAVAAGSDFTCALTRDGRAWCWGEGLFGRLGNASLESSATPVLVVGGHRFVSLAAGDDHTCALTASGDAWCWGANDSRQLGTTTGTCMPALPTISCASAPVPVDSGVAYRAIVAGVTTSCGLTTAAEIWCWGGRGYVLGRAVYSSSAALPAPVDAPGVHFTAAGIGWNHGCAVAADGRMRCWGAGTNGELGIRADDPQCDFFSSYNRTTCDRPAVLADTSRHWTDVAVGTVHTCALTSAGGALCWGSNATGALGHPGTPPLGEPVAVDSGLSYTALAASAYHTCGITTAGFAYCWGLDDRGQLGAGGAPSTVTCTVSGTAHPCRPSPVRVAAVGPHVTAISAGRWHSCAVTDGGEAWCWGRGTEGQLGDGAAANSNTPVMVAAPEAIP